MDRLVALLGSGLYVKLETEARRLLTHHPEDGFFWKALGIALSVQGKDSILALEKAAQMLPDDAEAHSNLGHALLEAGRLDEAEVSCRRALALQPDLVEAHNNLGNVLQRLGRFDQAAISYRNALALRPDFAKAHNNLGNTLRRLGRTEEAVTSFLQALDAKPDFAEAHNNLGNGWRDLARPDDAVDSFRRALQIQPHFAEAHSNLGNVLLDLGRLDDAVASYRRALDIQPDYAEAHNNLGNALRALGRLPEAVSSCRRALELRPDFAEAHNNLGNALSRLEQWDDASTSYGYALALDPDFAEAHRNLGDAQMKLWQHHAAVASYARALEIRPSYAEAHSKLGAALLHIWRHDDAVASCRRALEIQPDLVEAHNNLGNALLDLARHDEAEASYRSALTFEASSAESHHNLAYTLRLQHRPSEAAASCRQALELDRGMAAAFSLLAELSADQGDFTEAEQLFRRAISLDPDFPAPWAGLASIHKMTREDFDRLAGTQRMTTRSVAPREQVEMRYAMGNYCNDVGDFADAYEHYRHANDLTKAHGATHDRTQLARRIASIIESYDKTRLARMARDGHQSARPVFIVGMPRSGTTLAEQILASHPAIAAAGELSFWAAASARLEAQPLAAGVDPQGLGTLAGEYLRVLEDVSPDALCVIDKMPGNFFFLGLIHAAFPNARILHLRRNPIDTCLSIYFQNFGRAHTYANDPGDLADYYVQYLRLMTHWHATLPRGVILDVPYAGLVKDQEGWSRKMLEFIGLPWDSHCLDFYRTTRSVLTASRWQVRQNIASTSVDRWRNYDQFAAPLLGLMDAVRDYDRQTH